MRINERRFNKFTKRPIQMNKFLHLAFQYRAPPQLFIQGKQRCDQRKYCFPV